MSIIVKKLLIYAIQLNFELSALVQVSAVLDWNRPALDFVILVSYGCLSHRDSIQSQTSYHLGVVNWEWWSTRSALVTRVIS